MRPATQAVRDLLREDAAHVLLPDGMWNRINDRLDAAEQRAAKWRRAHEKCRAQLKSVLAFSVAMAVVGAALLPVSLQAEGRAAQARPERSGVDNIPLSLAFDVVLMAGPTR